MRYTSQLRVARPRGCARGSRGRRAEPWLSDTLTRTGWARRSGLGLKTLRVEPNEPKPPLVLHRALPFLPNPSIGGEGRQLFRLSVLVHCLSLTRHVFPDVLPLSGELYRLSLDLAAATTLRCSFTF